MVFLSLIGLLQLHVVHSVVRFKRCDVSDTATACSNQRNTSYATCTMGGCDQTGAKYCSCDGGNCTQTDSYGCTCDVKGGCMQRNATRSSCTGGTCTIDKTTKATQCCEGGECKYASGEQIAPDSRHLCADRGAKWKKTNLETYACEDLIGDNCKNDAECEEVDGACFAKPQVPSNTQLDGCIDHAVSVDSDTDAWSIVYKNIDLGESDNRYLLPVLCSARCHLSKIFAVNPQLMSCACGRLNAAESVAISEFPSGSRCAASQYAIYKRAATSVVFTLDSSGSMMGKELGEYRDFALGRGQEAGSDPLFRKCLDAQNATSMNKDVAKKRCIVNEDARKKTYALYNGELVDLGWQAYTCLFNALPHEIKEQKRVGVHWIAGRSRPGCPDEISRTIELGQEHCNIVYDWDADGSPVADERFQEGHADGATFALGADTKWYVDKRVEQLWYHRAAGKSRTYMWEYLSGVIDKLYVDDKVNMNYGHLEVTVISDGKDTESKGYFATTQGMQALTATLRGEYGIAPRFRVLCMEGTSGVCATGADISATGGSIQHFAGNTYKERVASVQEFCKTTVSAYQRCNITQFSFGSSCLNLPKCRDNNDCSTEGNNDDTAIGEWLKEYDLEGDFLNMKCVEKPYFGKTVKVCEDSDVIKSKRCTDSKKSGCACGESNAWCAKGTFCMDGKCLPECTELEEQTGTASRTNGASVIQGDCACGAQNNHTKCGLTQQCMKSGECLDLCSAITNTNCLCGKNKCSGLEVCASIPGNPKGKECRPECNAKKAENCACGEERTLCGSADRCVSVTEGEVTREACRPVCQVTGPTRGCACGKDANEGKCPVDQQCNVDGVCTGGEEDGGKEEEKEGGEKRAKKGENIKREKEEGKEGGEKEGGGKEGGGKEEEIGQGGEGGLKEGEGEGPKCAVYDCPTLRLKSETISDGCDWSDANVDPFPKNKAFYHIVCTQDPDECSFMNEELPPLLIYNKQEKSGGGGGDSRIGVKLITDLPHHLQNTLSTAFTTDALTYGEKLGEGPHDVVISCTFGPRRASLRVNRTVTASGPTRRLGAETAIEMKFASLADTVIAPSDESNDAANASKDPVSSFPAWIIIAISSILFLFSVLLCFCVWAHAHRKKIDMVPIE
eukprot:GEMP01004892.1.p1 GENE.GEMP01004892.1~~GEMP01004892.1.p1  ORF type:complete len:1132 (+),score=191.62 GEMP01004892.1:158-3553(+)